MNYISIILSFILNEEKNQGQFLRSDPDPDCISRVETEAGSYFSWWSDPNPLDNNLGIRTNPDQFWPSHPVQILGNSNMRQIWIFTDLGSDGCKHSLNIVLSVPEKITCKIKIKRQHFRQNLIYFVFSNICVKQIKNATFRTKDEHSAGYGDKVDFRNRY